VFTWTFREGQSVRIVLRIPPTKPVHIEEIASAARQNQRENREFFDDAFFDDALG